MQLKHMIRAAIITENHTKHTKTHAKFWYRYDYQNI